MPIECNRGGIAMAKQKRNKKSNFEYIEEETIIVKCPNLCPKTTVETDQKEIEDASSKSNTIETQRSSISSDPSGQRCLNQEENIGIEPLNIDKETDMNDNQEVCERHILEQTEEHSSDEDEIETNEEKVNLNLNIETQAVWLLVMENGNTHQVCISFIEKMVL